MPSRLPGHPTGRLLILACVAATSCSHSEALEVTRLFDGFVYAGELPTLNSWPVKFSGSPAKFPDRIRSRTYYVFYHRAPNDPVEFGLSLLPERLRDRRWAILKSPASIIEFEQPEPGQARFSITFENKTRKGRIFNRYDQNLDIDEDKRRIWGTEAYVIVFDEP